MEAKTKILRSNLSRKVVPFHLNICKITKPQEKSIVEDFKLINNTASVNSSKAKEKGNIKSNATSTMNTSEIINVPELINIAKTRKSKDH